MKKIACIAAVLMAIAATPLIAQNNTFFTNIGDLVFPFSPPPAAGTPGTIDNMAIGQTTPAPGSFTTLNANQVISSGGLPTIASGSCGTGANGAVVGGSTNQSGGITIGATGAPTSCTVSFSATLSSAPKACVLVPENVAAAQQDTTGAFVSSITTGHFVITGLALASTNYGYVCL